MNATSSLLIATGLCQLGLFQDYAPPPVTLPIEELSVEIVPIDVPDHPMFELFVQVPRDVETLRKQLPADNLSTVEMISDYPIEFFKKGISPLVFPLDNVPTNDPFNQKTSLRDAFVTQGNFWRQGKFAPLDAFSFSEVVHDRKGGYLEFIERIRAQYQRFFHTVVILFADRVRLGEEEYYLTLKFISLDDVNYEVSFAAYPGDKTFSLYSGQAILMACVPIESVILKPDFVRPQTLPSVPTMVLPEVVVDYENDPRYTLRLSDWVKSGLTLDEFVKQWGSNAYVLVETPATK